MTGGRAPYALVGESYEEWEKIGASPWLVRQLRFGLQLPWKSEPRFQGTPRYSLEPNHSQFAEEEIRRWLRVGFARLATDKEQEHLLRQGKVSPAFVTNTSSKLRLVIDYSTVNESLEERTFRMDQLGDLAAVLKPHDSLFRADLRDGYYHLRLRKCDQLKLAFMIGETVYIPFSLNCGLSVAPFFFTKVMRPVVVHLRSMGHRAFAYLDDFFGAARSSTTGPASPSDTDQLHTEMKALFSALGLQLRPDKCDFSGSRQLDILGILVDTERALFLLSKKKLSKIELQARQLLRYASQHKRYVRVKDIRKFAGLGNSVTPAVVDARLRLRELFNSIKLCHSCVTGHVHPRSNLTELSMSRVRN